MVFKFQATVRASNHAFAAGNRYNGAQKNVTRLLPAPADIGRPQARQTAHSTAAERRVFAKAFATHPLLPRRRHRQQNKRRPDRLWRHRIDPDFLFRQQLISQRRDGEIRI